MKKHKIVRSYKESCPSLGSRKHLFNYICNFNEALKSFQDSLCFREEARLHLEDCRRLSGAGESILADVDNRLEDVQASIRNLDIKKEELARERKRMLNTRSSLMCVRCQNPLADVSEMVRAGMTNLGLRTAGDGQVTTF